MTERVEQVPPTDDQLSAMPFRDQMAEYYRGSISIDDLRRVHGFPPIEDIIEAENRRREPYEVSDAKLLERAVRNCVSRDKNKGVAHARWVAVMDVFMVGSNYSRLICDRFGLDPDEMVKR